MGPHHGAAQRASADEEICQLSLPMSGQGGDLHPIRVLALSLNPLQCLSGGSQEEPAVAPVPWSPLRCSHPAAPEDMVLLVAAWGQGCGSGSALALRG